MSTDARPALLLVLVACRSPAEQSLQAKAGESNAASVVAGGSGTTSPLWPEPGADPTYHPPPGFESCVHAPVAEDCSGGWCRLRAGCFVMGSPENTPRRGMYSEDQVAVTLGHSFLIQQTEMTRRQWADLLGVDTRADPAEACVEDDCPITNVTWWDAVHAANLLSDREGLPRCYEPLDCTGTPGRQIACAGVAEPDRSVYGCAGYRLPTRAEAEYATRAGTTSPFYTGFYSDRSDLDCYPEPALERMAWFCFNAKEKTQPVARLEPNGFGLFDMAGNAYEWFNEWDTTRSSPGGLDPEGEVGIEPNRATSACGTTAVALMCRASNRFTIKWDLTSSSTGFRLVRSLIE